MLLFSSFIVRRLNLIVYSSFVYFVKSLIEAADKLFSIFAPQSNGFRFVKKSKLAPFRIYLNFVTALTVSLFLKVIFIYLASFKFFYILYFVFTFIFYIRAPRLSSTGRNHSDIPKHAGVKTKNFCVS